MRPKPFSSPSGLHISGSATLSSKGLIVSADQSLSQSFSEATLTFSDFFMISITSSIFAIATINPSTTCPLSFACLNSNNDLFVTTVFLCSRKIFRSSSKLHNFGLPSTRTTLLIPKTCSNCEFLNKLLRTTSGTSPFFNSITALIPSLSDSSLISPIPSSFFSFTSSAILSSIRALFTMNGISVITIASLPPFICSNDVFALV